MKEDGQHRAQHRRYLPDYKPAERPRYEAFF
jgi:hypothetical protein